MIRKTDDGKAQWRQSDERVFQRVCPVSQQRSNDGRSEKRKIQAMLDHSVIVRAGVGGDRKVIDLGKSEHQSLMSSPNQKIVKAPKFAPAAVTPAR